MSISNIVAAMKEDVLLVPNDSMYLFSGFYFVFIL